MKILNSSRKRNKKWELSHVNLKLVLFSFFILPLVTCSLWGQVVQKKQLTESDYHLWGELRHDKVSSNGKWTSYKMEYEKGIDTLFVSNTTTQKKYNFPSCSNSLFAGNDNFVCSDAMGLHLLNLTTGKQELFTSVNQCDYSSETNQLIFLSEAEHILKIVNLRTKVTDTINDVQQFTMSPSKKEILFTTATNQKHSIGLLPLGNKQTISWIIERNLSPFQHFAWQEMGKAVAFYSFSNSDSKDARLYYYTLDNTTLFELNPKTQSDFPDTTVFDKEMVYPLTISADMRSVFFGLSPVQTANPKEPESDVEIWNGNAKWIYPFEKINNQYSEHVTLAVWHPILKSITQISSPEFPKVMLTGNQKYAILSNPKEYEPQFEYDGPRDFYIMDLNTGKKEILLRKHIPFFEYLLPSPSGKFIAYFSDNNWYVYDIAHKTHTNVTKQINTPFFGKWYILDGDSAYGNAGWSKNDNELILYDQYDLWAIKPDGTSFKKLTNGREKQITFRIATLSDYEHLTANFDGWKSYTINLDGDLILHAAGFDEKTGYFKWKNDTGEKPIVYGDRYIDQMHYIQKEHSYIYQEQKFDLSPRLMFQKNGTAPKSFSESNPQQSKYQWGTAKLIPFRNSKGKELKAVLYYPANYDPAKKYPMIVNTYEKKSDRIHWYNNPTSFMDDGYNRTVFTLNGYFFLCPDIEYDQGTIGSDVVDCTVSATNEIIASGLVDPAKIGLVGHSFGGYESAFMITQTNLFSAVVAGAGITDLSSLYLNVGWDTGRPDMYRFQSEQWRIGKTPFEDPLLYAKSSPVANAANIKTPILIWTGKEDRHVDWHQSVEFYMALRRLGKKQIMLLYPDEKHVLLKPNNQLDLSHRVQEWFDYYLKKESPALWISEGVK
ncbi:S9 family peptidase [Flavobacterium sp. ZT3R18]|uniref:S9 family peptidase n=1 Tax=Flavobacterium sp. ZT3R18 TaxID=2594429 RepID=UPI001179D9F5|nr:prolyl oligopeptidase family serine peptidase [Flavobacterium sp. ZT3R18]TRX32554.1 S9 family peptidase [Flavobacterium sp. ZT3R18]